MKKKKTVVYLDTYCEGGYSYKDYMEYCTENNIEPQKENSNAYWEWISDSIARDVEDFLDNVKYSRSLREPVVVSGTLGLWTGQHDIANQEFSTLEEALKACWQSADDVKITLKDGVLHFEAMHHDGTNCFEIRPLTERGYQRLRDGDDINVKSYHHVKKFPQYLY